MSVDEAAVKADRHHTPLILATIFGTWYRLLLYVSPPRNSQRRLLAHLLRGSVVNGTYGTHKNVYIQLYLLRNLVLFTMVFRK